MPSGVPQAQKTPWAIGPFQVFRDARGWLSTQVTFPFVEDAPAFAPAPEEPGAPFLFTGDDFPGVHVDEDAGAARVVLEDVDARPTFAVGEELAELLAEDVGGPLVLVPLEEPARVVLGGEEWAGGHVLEEPGAAVRVVLEDVDARPTFAVGEELAELLAEDVGGPLVLVPIEEPARVVLGGEEWAGVHVLEEPGAVVRVVLEDVDARPTFAVGEELAELLAEDVGGPLVLVPLEEPARVVLGGEEWAGVHVLEEPGAVVRVVLEDVDARPTFAGAEELAELLAEDVGGPLVLVPLEEPARVVLGGEDFAGVHGIVDDASAPTAQADNEGGAALSTATGDDFPTPRPPIVLPPGGWQRPRIPGEFLLVVQRRPVIVASRSRAARAIVAGLKWKLLRGGTGLDAPFGLPPIVFPAGQPGALRSTSATSDGWFRARRLVLSAESLLTGIFIEDIRIGVRSCLASSGNVNPEGFAATAIDTHVTFWTVGPGLRVRVDARNDTPFPVTMGLTFYGAFVAG